MVTPPSLTPMAARKFDTRGVQYTWRLNDNTRLALMVIDPAEMERLCDKFFDKTGEPKYVSEFIDYTTGDTIYCVWPLQTEEDLKMKFERNPIYDDKLLFRSRQFGTRQGALDNAMGRTPNKTYMIRISSPFILTQKAVKDALGIGYTVESVEMERDLPQVEITDVDSAVDHMLKTGYRALVRANHPDLGGTTEKMVILNRAKKEIDDLLKELRSTR